MINIIDIYSSKFQVKKLFNNTYIILKDLDTAINFIQSLCVSEEFLKISSDKIVHTRLFSSKFLYLKNTFKLLYIFGYRDDRFLLKLEDINNKIYINLFNLDIVNCEYTIFNGEETLNFKKETLKNLSVYDPLLKESYIMKRGIFKWKRKK